MKNLSSINLIFIASCLFLVGSTIFTFEAILEIIKLSSIRTFIHFLACLFFTIGSFIFMHSAGK